MRIMYSKNTRFTFTVLLLSLCLAVGSCKKYEDGPLINLRSKAKRLSGVWKATKQVEDGWEFLNNHTMELIILQDADDPEGSFETYTYYTSDGSNAEEKYFGKWELSEDKEELIMYFTRLEYNEGQGWQTSNLHYTYTQEIKRLTTEDLWLQDVADSYDLYLEYEKQ